MLFIGVFELGGVNGLVVRAEEGEDDGDEGSEAEGEAKGRVQRSGGELE